jgi:hypothetical protein
VKEEPVKEETSPKRRGRRPKNQKKVLLQIVSVVKAKSDPDRHP